MSKDFNIYSLAEDAEDYLHNTDNIVGIDYIVTGIEEAYKRGDDMTDKIPISVRGILGFVKLEMDKVDSILKSLLHTCEELDEFEMCIRIQKLIKDE